MKKLLLALLLLPALSHAGMNANSIDVFNAPVNCTNEASALGQSSAPMSVTGTVSYVTSPAPPNSGTYCATGSDSNYWNFGPLTNLEFSSVTKGGIEMDVDFTAITNLPILFEYTDPVGIAGGSHQVYIIVVNSTTWELVLAGSAVLVATNSITLNTWHNFVWYWDGTTMTMSMDGTTGGTLSTAFQTHTITSGVIGRALPLTGSGYNIQGYYTQVRFLKNTPGNPTVDSPSCAGSPTNTPAPTATLTPTPNWSATNTPAPTSTFTLTPTPVLTFTPNPSITPDQLRMTQHPTKALNCQTETDLRNLVDFLYDSGIAAGYAVFGGIWIVHIDDVWCQATRDGSGSLQANSNWPHLLDGGDKAYANAKGIKLELYIGIGTKGCLGVSMGCQGHEQHDMNQLGPITDFITGDTCFIGQVNPVDSFKLIGYYLHQANPQAMFGIWGPFDTTAANYSWQPPLEYQTGARFWWTPIGDAGPNWGSSIGQWSNAYISGANAYSPTHGRMQQGSLRLSEGMTTASDLGIDALATTARDDKFYFAVGGSSTAAVIAELGNTNLARVECDSLGAPGVQLTTPGSIEAIGGPLADWRNYEVSILNNTGSTTQFTFTYTDLTESGSALVYDITDNVSKGINTTSFVQSVSPNGAVLLAINFGYSCTPTPSATPTVTASPTNTPAPTATLTPTLVASPTNTPVCVNPGELTPGPTPVSVWSTCFMKSVTTASTNKLCAVNVYVSATAGSLMVGIYDTTGYLPHLVGVSAVVTATTGWNKVPLVTRILPAGTYYIAVEASDALSIGSKLPGLDLYTNASWGNFASFVKPYNLYRDYSINAVFCAY